jgi:O-antigen ligase
MTYFKVREAIFPITLLAFEAIGVKYWNVIFTNSTRWVLVAILFLSVLMRGQFLLAFRTRSGFLLAAYLFWCTFTITWSEMPELSMLKSIALIVIVMALSAAGQAWTFHSERNAPFGFLLPIVILALFAGFFDRGAAYTQGTIKIYQGLSGNPNFLGAIAAMSIPYAVWQAYKNRTRMGAYVICISIITGLLVALWYSGSRSSMLAALSIFTVFFVALSPKKRIMAFGLVGVLSLSAAIAAPAIQASLYERFVVKGDLRDQDVFATRQEVWSKSYDLAQQGGVVGAGYGVTIGAPIGFSVLSFGLTSVGYGREKGNTALAIWEETGMVGLVLYVLLILTIMLELGFCFARIKDRDRKVQLGLLFGAILGFTIQSFFEAWWVAPGSAEFAFFWAIVGAAQGLVRRANFRGQPVRQRVLNARYQTTGARAAPSAVTGA